MPEPGPARFAAEDPLLSDPFVRGLSRELQRARQAVDTGGTASQSDEGGLSGVVSPPRRGFWARLTAQNATDKTLYSFVEVIRDPGSTSTFVIPNGAITLTDKAREANLNQTVPLSSVVWMEPSPGTFGSMYDFGYDAAGSPTSPTYPAGSTVTLQSGATLNVQSGGTLTLSGALVTPQPAPVTLSSATYNNYTLPSGGTVNFNPTATGGVTITGLAPAAPGQQITIVNNGTVPLFFPNQDPGSSTPNQVRPPWGGALTIPPCGTAQLQAGKGAGGEWGVVNPGAMPIPWMKPSGPTSMGGDFNNFDPTGNSIIQLDPLGGDWHLTGIKPQFPGAHLTITVPATATGTVTLTDHDPASSPGNQLSLANGASVVLKPGQSLDLTAGAGGDFGSTESLNGPAAAGGGGGGGGAALTNYSGTTTDAYVVVFDATDVKGLHGCVNVKNTGLTNALAVRLTLTDMYGNVVPQTPVLAGGIITAYDLDGTVGGNSWPPFKEAKLEVKANVAGAQTTYASYLALVGGGTVTGGAAPAPAGVTYFMTGFIR
jgi:hypothetical protein